MFWADVNDLTEFAREHWVLLAVLAGMLIAVLVLLRIAGARKREHPDLEKALRENLAEYPPLPPATGGRLLVNATPARLRLVVVAPPGKHHDSIAMDDVPALLDEIIRGLGARVATDKPRVTVWPPQLSTAGFGPKFHRLVTVPDASRWLKLAGPARTGKRPVLLGLALFVDEPSRLGEVIVETTEWGELIEVER
jgi:hypothetical protein